ncbi:ABC transporter ATP-binding protein [Lacihabitans lacunae]|uniref:ABC transporter ATP-binding protein n=1 Tax=Lacihabitans lacunae TaxID=1028214 RepID=A0ABV7YWD6_9BACT
MIEAKKINFSYSKNFALKNINLRVKNGEILGLIGESGSGKSTLLKILSGLLSQDSGQILFENEEILKASEKLVPGHKEIKTVTQNNTLFPNISIAENIKYELRYYQKSYQEEKLKSLADLVKIKHLLSKYPRELSGGEIQRVLIAKAISDEPKVLLLDEPFSNLDSIIKKKILFELKDIISKQNIACVFVTHEITDALGLVNSLVILKNGKIVQKGSSEEIYFSPKSEYVGLLTSDGFIINNVSLLEKLHINEASKILLRPEHIFFKNTGKIAARVKHSIFKGSHFEIWFSIENDPDSAYYFKSEIKIESETAISLDFEGYLILK